MNNGSKYHFGPSSASLLPSPPRLSSRRSSPSRRSLLRRRSFRVSVGIELEFRGLSPDRRGFAAVRILAVHSPSALREQEKAGEEEAKVFIFSPLPRSRKFCTRSSGKRFVLGDYGTEGVSFREKMQFLPPFPLRACCLGLRTSKGFP